MTRSPVGRHMRHQAALAEHYQLSCLRFVRMARHQARLSPWRVGPDDWRRMWQR